VAADQVVAGVGQEDLMAKKPKISRKEFLKKPDEFVSGTARALEWAAAHRKQLIYGVTTVVVAALLLAAHQFVSSRAEKRAFQLLAQNLAKYDELRSKQDPAKAYQAVSSEFQQLVDKYGTNEGGKLARVIYANICFESGHYQQAVDLYNQALNDFEGEPLVRNLILNGLGYAYEQLNDFAAAAKFFDRVVKDPKALMPAEAWFNLGCLYAKLGENEKSRQAFQKILSDYKDSMYYDMVKERLAEETTGPSSAG
jgi:tetratricopeptide (TPR) repeat protein